MAWELTDDLERFMTAAEAYLRSRPVQHTTLLTLISALRRRGFSAYGLQAPFFGAWRDHAGVVAGVLLQTPPRPVLFGEMPPEAVTEAVGALSGQALSGVNLPDDQLDLFVSPWVSQTGVLSSIYMRTRLYRLTSLASPFGSARTGLPGDRELLISWVRDFLSDIGEPPSSSSEISGIVDDALALGVVTVALDDDVPASMVMRTEPSSGVARIRYVFTPASLRGRGFAGAATVAACSAALGDGASEVVLFTDLGNPTSNGLYQRLGFRPVQDRTVVTFT
jgi:hypothetical protein